MCICVINEEMMIEKRYYSIGEVAEIFSVATSLIRFWESQFEEIKPRKNKNGVRQYTKLDIEAIQTVFYLVKEKGYTLHGAKELLKEKPEVHETMEIIDKLENVKRFLISLKGGLNKKEDSEGIPAPKDLSLEQLQDGQIGTPESMED